MDNTVEGKCRLEVLKGEVPADEGRQSRECGRFLDRKAVDV